MNEVKIIRQSGVTYFHYKGLVIDTETWECVSCPMCCKDITDDDYCSIVKELYDELVRVFGVNAVTNYIEKGQEYGEFEDIDNFRWVEEENLFLDYGGKYYEDMTNEEYAEVCGLNI